jgi:hypothetical protein
MIIWLCQLIELPVFLTFLWCFTFLVNTLVLLTLFWTKEHASIILLKYIADYLCFEDPKFFISTFEKRVEVAWIVFVSLDMMFLHALVRKVRCRLDSEEMCMDRKCDICRADTCRVQEMHWSLALHNIYLFVWMLISWSEKWTIRPHVHRCLIWSFPYIDYKMAEVVLICYFAGNILNV